MPVNHSWTGAVILATLAILGRFHVTIWLAGIVPCAVPVPVLILVAELAVIAGLAWQIARRWPFSLRMSAREAA